jgi:hypothetical protein
MTATTHPLELADSNHVVAAQLPAQAWEESRGPFDGMVGGQKLKYVDVVSSGVCAVLPIDDVAVCDKYPRPA